MVRSTMEEVAVHVTLLWLSWSKKSERRWIMSAKESNSDCLPTQREQNVMIGTGTWTSFLQESSYLSCSLMINLLFQCLFFFLLLNTILLVSNLGMVLGGPYFYL
ncbi:hypothetical protein GmHk_10G029579 [Glycine max]|nr:hypothetical protein GmHk_10G029579 [Glycine max]RZB87802.1 hypothetical protein D0Y65_027380 [Glycine soja]